MPMLEIKNLRKSFDGLDVLKGISLSVEKGDVISILGPSGGGKTTFLRCVNFLEKADGGEMVFDGRHIDLARVSGREMREVRMKTGFVFQNYNLFLNKTALQNVTEGLVTARRMEKAKAESLAMAALDKVGLAERASYYPVQLSGGQQQRVAIARALVTEPEIIYFDEPTSALDPELTGEVLSVMRDLAREGQTLLVVTHEIGFARNVSSRVCFIEGGVMVESAPVEEFFGAPKEARTRAFIQAITSKEV